LDRGGETNTAASAKVPETIFDRRKAVAASEKPPKTFLQRQGLDFPKPTRHAEESWGYTFSRPFAMFAYPSVVFPSLWFSVAGMTEVANTAGFALNFGLNSRWKFSTLQVGFCSFSGLIGAVVGEILAGPLCDMVAKHSLRRGAVWKPEKLLPLSLTGLVCVTVGHFLLSEP
jgi:hypothetical protein